MSSSLGAVLARRVGIGLLLVCLAVPATAQDSTQPPSRSHPADSLRIGLALSGGGAKGFAHIGVLKTLEELNVPVDVVTGTSMGAVVGGLYASGYSPASLDSIAMAQDWTEVFSDAARRRLRPLDQRVSDERTLISLPLNEEGVQLPTGLIAGQQVSQFLNRLLLPVSHVRDFNNLPIPFAAVATNIESGEPVLFRSGYLPRVLRASMAIPSVFSPTTIGEETYIDGGVARNLPAEDARKLGADLIICSNVGTSLQPADSLSTFIDVLIQTMWYRGAASTEQQLDMCDISIQPQMEPYGMFSFGSTATIVKRGHEAAEKNRRALAALVDSVHRKKRDRKRSRPPPTRASITEIRVDGVSPLVAQRVRATLDLPIPARRTADELSTAIERVYAMGLFTQVTYRLEQIGRGRRTADQNVRLVVQAEMRPQERLRLGLRYSSAYRASILLNASFHDQLGFGATSELDLRLGEVLRADLRYNVPVAFRPNVSVGLGARAERIPIDLFFDGRRISSVVARVLTGSLRFGGTFMSDVAAGIGVTGESFDIDERVGDGLPFDDDGLLLGEALLYADTFDRAAFANSGAQVLLKTSATSEAVLSSGSFSQHLFHGEGRLPITSRITGIGSAVLGRTIGDPPPVYRRYYLGGAVPFRMLLDHHFRHFGYSVQELSGRNVQAVRLGVQLALPYDLYVTPRWNTARVAETWKWRTSSHEFRKGYGLTLGRPTLLGPVELTVMAKTLDGPYGFGIEVGHTF